MKVRGTLVNGDHTQSFEFEITKTKEGKFAYATQKNVEQFLDAAASGKTVIFSPPVETDAWLDSALKDLRKDRRLVELVKYVRDRFEGSLVGSHNCIRRYINPTERDEVLEIGITRLLVDMSTGQLRKKVQSMTAYYNQDLRSLELEKSAWKGDFAV